MWGGPMPHNLVILCLCYANQTCSEVPISSSNRDTARLGRGDRILLPSVIPAQVQGRHNTTRSTLTIGYPLRIQRRQTRRGITPGIPFFLAIANQRRRISSDQLHGAVTRIGSCSLEKRQGRPKRKQCVRSDRLIGHRRSAGRM